MKRAFATVLRVGIGLAGLAGCGGGNRDPKQPRLDHDNNRHADDRSVAAQPGPTPEAEASASTCPGSVHATEVTGLTLPTANKKLSAAGFKADVSNTDTTFGILVPPNSTVCKQSSPRGKIVPILAQKYGC